MDPNDKELMEQLARDPFPRSGFNARLRQRIGERIDREQGRTRRPWKSVWRLPAAALASVVFLALGIWLWNGHAGNTDSVMNADTAPRASGDLIAAVTRDELPKKYALLVGLRKDEKTKGTDWPTSSYRTVLVAQETVPGQPKLIANLAGLYVPHEQNFWEIATLEGSGGRQSLQAVQATNRKKQQAETLTVPPNRLSERVLFAGNRYLSLEVHSRNPQGQPFVHHWVKTIDLINTKSGDPSTEPHIRLEGVLPDKVTNPPVDQWQVIRNPGQWMADLPDLTPGSDGTGFPAALPGDVVNPDSLSMNWEQILEIEPAARDSFTYGNLLGIVTGNEIRVYQVKDGKTESGPVAFPVQPGETVIMIQWAQYTPEREDYVDKWIKVARSLPSARP